MPAAWRALRGEPLAMLARELEQLRTEGKACWRCPRLLAGGACPDHGRTRPPRMRDGHQAARAARRSGAGLPLFRKEVLPR